LARMGGSGFPSFALARGDGRLERIDASPWLGRPEAWQQHLAPAARQAA